MIEPHMATMLAFIATDARLSATAVDAALRGAVDESFNCVTVDSDTSTNDSCVLRSEEHTSELQSLMRISYDVFCFKQKKHKTDQTVTRQHSNDVHIIS